jgi:hypothetical protein
LKGSRADCASSPPSSPRGSHAAAAAITRATGVKLGKRQVEELGRRTAADVDGFCHDRRPDPAPEDHALVLTCDGKGIVMRPEALRPARAKAAATARNKLATRLSPGKENGWKRMAELACVYDAVLVPRAPEDIITPPGKRRKQAGKGQRGKPYARGKWLTASVTDDIPAVIAAFEEAQRDAEQSTSVASARIVPRRAVRQLDHQQQIACSRLNDRAPPAAPTAAASPT